MKHNIKRILNLLLVTLMIMTLPGFSKTIEAASTKELAEGTIFFLGDTIQISGDANVWVRYEDKDDFADTIKPGNYTLPASLENGNYDSSKDQWCFYGLFADKYGDPVSLCLGYGTASASVKPIGIKCYYGDGTEIKPYHFELVYGHTVTFETYGYGVINDQTVVHGEKANRPADPAPDFTTTGLTFRKWLTVPMADLTYDNWNYNDGADGILGGKGAIFSFDTTINKDYNLYAGYDGVLNLYSYDLSTNKDYEGGTFTYYSPFDQAVSETKTNIGTTAIAGTTVTLTAYPDDDHRFAGWSTDKTRTNIVSSNNPYSFTYERRTTLYALFEEKNLNVDLGVTEGGTVTVSEYTDTGSQGTKTGEIKGKGYDTFSTEKNYLRLTATPDRGYVFSGFYEGNMKDGHVEGHTDTLVDRNADKFFDRGSEYKQIEAVFEKYFYPTVGNNQTWTKGSGNSLSVTFDLKEGEGDPFDRFKGIIIDEDKDEKLIEHDSEGREEIYSFSRGSVIITLTPGYLETLSVGEHTLTAVIMVPERDDMKTDAKFTIAEKSSGGTSDSSTPVYRLPKTGIE